jgi:hypothetical protein
VEKYLLVALLAQAACKPPCFVKCVVADRDFTPAHEEKRKKYVCYTRDKQQNCTFGVWHDITVQLPDQYEVTYTSPSGKKHGYKVSAEEYEKPFAYHTHSDEPCVIEEGEGGR